MQNDNKEITLQNIFNEKIKYASQIECIDFLTENIKKINMKKIIFLNKNIDRAKIINKFADILKNIDNAIKIEASIFEFTLVYVNTKNYITRLMPAIYNDKVN